MVRIVFVVLTLGSALGFLHGCGSQPVATPPEERADVARREALMELNDLLQLRETDTGGKPATRAADLAKYDKLYAVAWPKVKDGHIIVLFGAPLDKEGSDKVLAYEKAVPESGGYVMMQDGTTIKKMTAEEFKAAPKAPGTAPANSTKK